MCRTNLLTCIYEAMEAQMSRNTNSAVQYSEECFVLFLMYSLFTVATVWLKDKDIKKCLTLHNTYSKSI